MTISGYILNDTQVELFNEIVDKCKKENRKDYEEVFRELIQEKIKFYNCFIENLEMNIINIDSYFKGAHNEVLC